MRESRFSSCKISLAEIVVKAVYDLEITARSHPFRQHQAYSLSHCELSHSRYNCETLQLGGLLPIIEREMQELLWRHLELPRGAIGQLLDYFGMMKARYPEKAVELMVVATTIPSERRIAWL
jgi:hypothetical protein